MTIVVSPEQFYLFNDVGVKRPFILVEQDEESSSTDEGGNE